MSKVDVVFCMDTEGPCDDPNNDSLLKTWEDVDPAMDKLFDKKFRSKYKDSIGNGLKIGWFFLTWTGFKTNPRGRDFGYHKVRDHYVARWGKLMNDYGDEECWHYHHPPVSGVGNEWGLDWNSCQEYEQIISRQILDRRWFPTCYRAGGTIVTPQSSRWVDSWFPFDFSNRAPLSLSGLVNWSDGVTDWSLYHPDQENFTKPGAGNRLMARCMDLVTGVYSLSDDEIHKAFQRARDGRPALLSVFDHDYRDIADRIDNFCARVTKVAEQYPEVSWGYSNPTEAIRNYIGAPNTAGVKLYALINQSSVRIWSTRPLFQHIPWISLELQTGEVIHCTTQITRVSQTEWVWEIPSSLRWVRAGIAGSTVDGHSDVTIIVNGEPPLHDFFVGALKEHPSLPNSIEHHSKLLPQLCIQRASGQNHEMDCVKQARELLAPLVSPNDRLLDVGCASGQAWLTLSKLKIDYFGIDDFQMAIEIGKSYLSESGLPPQNLRHLDIENLSSVEQYDFVINLFKFRSYPSYRLPLEIMARAAKRVLIIRGTFGAGREERYLPDVLLEPGFQSIHASFNICSKEEIEEFLKVRGFSISWVPDQRQLDHFKGSPEIVGGISFLYEFMVATRISSPPSEDDKLDQYWKHHARLWSAHRIGLPKVAEPE